MDLKFEGESAVASRSTTEVSSMVCLEPLSSAASASISKNRSVFNFFTTPPPSVWSSEELLPRLWLGLESALGSAFGLSVSLIAFGYRENWIFFGFVQFEGLHSKEKKKKKTVSRSGRRERGNTEQRELYEEMSVRRMNIILYPEIRYFFPSLFFFSFFFFLFSFFFFLFMLNYTLNSFNFCLNFN